MSVVNHNPNDSKRVTKQVIHMIIYFGLIIILALALNTFIIQKVRVKGESMENTFHDSEQLILEKVTYYSKNPKRYDVVVFKPYENLNNYFIKRVIGLPGETVQIKDGDVYINGKHLSEGYGKEKMLTYGLAEQPVKLGPDEYFVLGDNRNNSKDSRSDEVGLVNKHKIAGKVVFRLWPLSKFGAIK